MAKLHSYWILYDKILSNVPCSGKYGENITAIYWCFQKRSYKDFSGWMQPIIFNEIFNLLLKLRPIMYPTSPRATTLQFGRCIPFLEHLAVKKTFTYLQSRKFLIVLVEDD